MGARARPRTMHRERSNSLLAQELDLPHDTAFYEDDVTRGSDMDALYVADFLFWTTTKPFAVPLVSAGLAEEEWRRSVIGIPVPDPRTLIEPHEKTANRKIGERASARQRHFIGVAAEWVAIGKTIAGYYGILTPMAVVAHA